MFDWTTRQWQAGGKNILSYAAGLVTMAAAWGLLSSTDAAGITENVNLISDGLKQVAKGVAGLSAILIPIYTAWKAAHNASPKEQINAVVTNLSAPQSQQAANAVADPESRNKIIAAVAQMPEVKAVLTTPAVAMATPASPNVVATVAEVQKAA